MRLGMVDEMAKVIEYFIPEAFRKRIPSIPFDQVGKILCFPETKSALEIRSFEGTELPVGNLVLFVGSTLHFGQGERVSSSATWLLLRWWQRCPHCSSPKGPWTIAKDNEGSGPTDS